jgi:hypothetical protein
VQPGNPEPIAADGAAAEPEVSAQRAFDRIEPHFTLPSGGTSLGDATTFADAPAILPTLRKPAERAEPAEPPEPATPAVEDPGIPQQRVEAAPGTLPPPVYPPQLPLHRPSTAAYPPVYPPAAPGYRPGMPSYQGAYPQPAPYPPAWPYPGAYPPGPYQRPAIPPWQPAPPPRKKHPGRTVLIALISAAVLLGLPGLAAALSSPPAPTRSITLPRLPEPLDSTKVGDATKDRATVMSVRVAKILQAQEEAIKVHDEAAFVKAVATTAAADALRLRYRNLTAMNVAEYHLSASFPQAGSAKGRWTSTLTVDYCFGQAGCDQDEVNEPMVWQDTAIGPALVSLGVQPFGRFVYEQPQPWEQTPLVAAVGVRVVVAMPVSLKSRLQTVLREAESAAVGGPPDPGRAHPALKPG